MRTELEHEAIVRKLSAVVVADVSGYTRLMHKNESQTHIEYRERMNELVTPLLAEYAGQNIKSTGDGFVAAFHTASAALVFSSKLQEGMRIRNERLPADSKIEFRVGISFGEIIFEANDVFGDDVNIAARLEQLAQPGDIFVSESAFRAARNQDELNFEDIGKQKLKNIGNAVRVYRVRPGGSGRTESVDKEDRTTDVPRAGLRKARPLLPSVVVLPLSCHSANSADGYFGAGLTEELISDLSRFSSTLSVVAARTAFQYRNSEAPIRQIRKELGVRYVVEGSFLKTDDLVRLSVRLIDAEHDRSIWSRKFVQRFDDLPALQDDLLHHILAELSICVDQQEHERAKRKRPAKMNAYDAYLRGVQAWREHLQTETKESLIESRKWQKFALSLEPNYARPLSNLAYSYAWGWRQGWDDSEVLVLARSYAERAVSLDPYNYDCHWDLGYCYLTLGDFAQALLSYERALELNKHDPLLIAEVAELYSNLGLHRKALRFIKQATELDPHPDYYIEVHAWVLFFLRQYRSTLKKLKTLKNPTHHARLLTAASHAQLAGLLEASGRSDLAVIEARNSHLALVHFLAARPTWTIAREMRACTFKRTMDANLWREGLERAGLADG